MPTPGRWCDDLAIFDQFLLTSIINFTIQSFKYSSSITFLSARCLICVDSKWNSIKLDFISIASVRNGVLTCQRNDFVSAMCVFLVNIFCGLLWMVLIFVGVIIRWFTCRPLRMPTISTAVHRLDIVEVCSRFVLFFIKVIDWVFKLAICFVFHLTCSVCLCMFRVRTVVYSLWHHVKFCRIWTIYISSWNLKVFPKMHKIFIFLSVFRDSHVHNSFDYPQLQIYAFVNH